MKPAFLLANAEVAEDLIQNILHIDSAGETAQSCRGGAQVFGAQLQLARRALQEGAQGGLGALQLLAMAGAGDRRAFRAADLLADALEQLRQQGIEAVAGQCGDRDHAVGDWAGGGIALVGDPQRFGRAVAAAWRQIGRRAGQVLQPEHKVGLAHAVEGAADAFALDRAFGLADAGGVDQDDGIAAEIEPHLDDVAGGAGLLRDDGGIAPGEHVHQAGLAGIGRSGDHHAEAVAQDLAAAGVGQMRGHFRDQHLHRGLRGRGDGLGDVALIGEVERGLERGAGCDQPCAPAVIERPQPAIGLTQRLAPLGLGLGVDQVGEAFGGGEVELAVLEGAAGELARLGEAHVGEAGQRAEHALDHRAAAMDVQLGHVLAGEAPGAAEEQNQPAIEQFAVFGVADYGKARDFRLRNAASHALQHFADLRPGHTDHGHTRLPMAAGEGINRDHRRFSSQERYGAEGASLVYNRLAEETSPYLLQHKDNPVHWWPWGEAAFAEAKQGGRPVLLSVGYAACHWCHVMAHESFEDPEIAALMNQLFVNIKVDREERPDVDALYMAALHELGEQGGWPLTMFLTPDGEPFWGGTYFPKAPLYGRASFPHVLREISRIYRDEGDKIRNNADALKSALQPKRPPEDAHIPTVNEPLLADFAGRLAEAIDR